MNELDADVYRINFEYVKNHFEGKTFDEAYDLIGPLATMTYVPIVVVCLYVGELYGFNDKLEAFYKKLMAFYKVDKVTSEIANITLSI